MAEEKEMHVNVRVEGAEEASHGIGMLAMFAIPLVIVAAGSGLIGAYVEFHTGRHEVKQINRAESAQQRADDRVGAHELPKSPINLIISSEGPCVSLDSGYLDNGEFVGYVKNSCDHVADYYQLFLNGMSPDGTVVQSDYENTAFMPQIPPHMRAEVHAHLGGYRENLDDRIVTISARIKGHE